MKNILVFLLVILLLDSCSPIIPRSPIPQTESIQPSFPTSTPFSLGKCFDARSPTPNPKEASLFPAIGETDHTVGNPQADVTILDYSDFQCASCAQIDQLLSGFVNKYPGKILFVFRNFPIITLHDKAALAAQAAEAASQQNKFWEMHDFLFQNLKTWETMTPEVFKTWIVQESTSLGIDRNKFSEDFSSQQVSSRVQKSFDDGMKINLPGVPILLINGELVKWEANLFENLENYVKLAILSKQQFNSCPDTVISPGKKYRANLVTTKGKITIDLFTDQAPIAVNNFIFLAKKGWFNKTPFFKVVPNELVESGDPSGTGFGGPGYFLPTENNNLLYDRAGMVGMLNTGPNSNGSQFLITMAPAPNFNGSYPIFGFVSNGMDVLSKLTPYDPNGSNGKNIPDMIISVQIEEQ